MDEAETRAEHIDPALKAAGRGVVEGCRILREHGIALGRSQNGARRSAPRPRSPTTFSSTAAPSSP